MRVGALLLTQEDKYLIDGALPARPPYDKDWLEYLCSCATGITYSPATGKTLPEWAKKPAYEWDLNLGIATLNDEPDILLVTRTYDVGDGPEFRMGDWELVDVQVYKRRNK